MASLIITEKLLFLIFLSTSAGFSSKMNVKYSLQLWKRINKEKKKKDQNRS